MNKLLLVLYGDNLHTVPLSSGFPSLLQKRQVSSGWEESMVVVGAGKIKWGIKGNFLR